MKKTILILLAFGLIINTQAQSQDEMGIKKVVTQFETVFNQKDAKATAMFWAAEVTISIIWAYSYKRNREILSNYFYPILSNCKE